jgi:hypothetical protein
MPRMLDLFCGRFGWSRAFAARGWECVGVDLVEPPEIPQGCEFVRLDVMEISAWDGIVYSREDIESVDHSGSFGEFDFICASSPCEQFSVHCMKFTKKKDHPYPELGIQLFNHTRALCEASLAPYVMENVRCAEQFIGTAVGHAGSFYLWGNAVPPILPKGLIKMGNQGGWRKTDGTMNMQAKFPRITAARSATIPPELANCVAEYAERLLEQANSKEQVSGRDPEETISSDEL